MAGHAHPRRIFAISSLTIVPGSGTTIRMVRMGVAFSQSKFGKALVDLMSRSPRWQGIGATYLRRYLRSGDEQKLADSLATLRYSAATTAGSHGRVRLACVSALSGALQASYQRSGDPDALREAV